MSSKKRILIVEDNPIWQETLQNMIEDEGLNEIYDIETVYTFGQAKHELKTKTVDLVISDLRLDEGDPANQSGLDLIRFYKTHTPTKPSIIITLYPRDEYIQTAFQELGVNDFINKIELDSGRLKTSIKEALTSKGTESQIGRISSAFALMPFDQSFDPIWGVIREALNEEEILGWRADDFFFPGVVIDRIYQKIDESDFIIADLSEQNANVLHETGYAHAKQKKVITITHERIRNLPSQLQGLFHLKYSNMLGGSDELKANLRTSLQQTATDDKVLFPIDPDLRVDPQMCLIIAGKRDGGVFEQIVEAVTADLGLRPVWETDVFTVGNQHSIMEIWREMQTAKYCIANISGQDPIIYYLTGMAQGLEKNLILLTEVGENTPFDFRTRTFIRFDDSLKGGNHAIKRLKSTFEDLEELGDQTGLPDVTSHFSEKEMDIAGGLSDREIIHSLTELFTTDELREIVLNFDGDLEKISSLNNARPEIAKDITAYYRRRGLLPKLSLAIMDARPFIDWEKIKEVPE